MRGRLKVSIDYYVDTNSEYYTHDNYDFDDEDSPEMKLVKGVKADFEDHEGPYEDLCLPGGEVIREVEFVKWLET